MNTNASQICLTNNEIAALQMIAINEPLCVNLLHDKVAINGLKEKGFIESIHQEVQNLDRLMLTTDGRIKHRQLPYWLEFEMSFQTTLDTLKASIASFILLMDKNFSKNVINEYRNIAPDTNVSFDLETLLGTNHALYDKKRAKVCVRIRDTDPVSQTYNMMINSEAVIVTGISQDRYVYIYNGHSATVESHISIDVPKIQ